jgi:type I restriction enzyme S subunit
MSDQKSILGLVPDDWNVLELGDLGSWGGGSTPRKSNYEYWGGSMPWVSPKDMGESVVRRTEDHVTKEALSQTNLSVYRPGSVVVVFRSGVLRHTFPVATLDQPFTVNQDMKVLTTRNEIDDRFAFHLLRCMGPMVLQRATKVGTTVESVDTTSFKSLPVGIPAFSEQRRIADVLDTVDAAIRETDDVIAKQEQVKTGLLQDLLTRGLDSEGRLRDPEANPGAFRETELGRLPKDWGIARISEVGKVVTGTTPSTSRPEYYDGEIPFARPAEVANKRCVLDTEKSLTEEGATKARMLPPEAVLVTCIGNLGRVAQAGRRMATNQQINSIIPGSEIDSAFLYYAASVLERQMRAEAGLQVVPNVNKTRFSSLYLPLPEIAEQKRIVALLKKQDGAKSSELDYSNKLQTLKTGLMQDLLTGRVRVPEAEERVQEITR